MKKKSRGRSISAIVKFILKKYQPKSNEINSDKKNLSISL